MKRITFKTMEFDYSTFDEFTKHRDEMNKRGWAVLKDYEIDELDMKHHAIYVTGKLYNGINGR